MTTDSTSYNGYKNYETWSCQLWIDNDESNHRHWMRRARDCWRRADTSDFDGATCSQAARISLAREVQTWIDDNCPPVPNSMYSDILNANLREIDTYEIADNLLEACDLDRYVPRRTLAAQEAGG